MLAAQDVLQKRGLSGTLLQVSYLTEYYHHALILFGPTKNPESSVTGSVFGACDRFILI